MRKTVLRIGFSTFLMLAALTLLTISTQTVVKADNKHAEHIIFSGVGTFSGGSVPGSPFGFWIWCISESSGNGIYSKDLACSGAMYIYALGITKGVFGFGSNGGVVENADGTYTMNVHSADLVIQARLTNVLPVKSGPSNTVNVTFTAPAGVGSGTSTNAVVLVTGKE
jgi:hypothetical protein